MADNMTDKQKKILETYRRCSSMHKTAKLCECSDSTVIKTLITYGVYETELTKRVKYLADRGFTTQEIAETIGKSETTVKRHLPYTRGTYLTESEQKSKSAKQKARWRAQKKQQKET